MPEAILLNLSDEYYRDMRSLKERVRRLEQKYGSSRVNVLDTRSITSYPPANTGEQYIAITDIEDTPTEDEADKVTSSEYVFDHNANISAHHAKYTDAEVDAIVLTHKNLASAHHTKYTDAEVDAIVLTHKNLASAHHTKYTDAETIDAVEAVGNAPIATGDSVIFKDATDGVLKQDLVSDLLALGGGGLTEEQVADIVGAMFSGNTETRITATYQDADNTIDLVVDDMTGDTQLTTEQVQDIVGAMVAGNTETRITVTYVDADNNLDFVVDNMDNTSAIEAYEQVDSANGEYISLIPAGDAGSVVTTAFFGGVAKNLGTNNMNISYELPMASTKNGKFLRCTDFRIILYDADPNDYITQIRVFKLIKSTRIQTTMYSDTDNLDAAGEYNDGSGVLAELTDFTIADGDKVAMMITCSNVDANQLIINDVSIKCHYV